MKNLLNSGTNKNLTGHTETTIDEERLSTRSENSSSEMRWPGFEGFEEGKEHFFLYIAINQAFVIPKKAFQNQEDMNYFKEFIQSKLNHANVLDATMP